MIETLISKADGTGIRRISANLDGYTKRSAVGRKEIICI